jgi:hypothetical protein
VKYEVAGLIVAALAVSGSVRLQPDQSDGKREFTISGCLLRSGYAGYQVDEAQLEAIDGKAVTKEAAASAAPPRKWILDGGGNLGADTGKKIQVVGRSDWRPASEAPADEPPNRTPHLDVKSVKTLAPNCS